MGDLRLEGVLDLTGALRLVADSGTVKASGREVLVERRPDEEPHSENRAPPVVLPPPPASPIDPGTRVWALASLNKTVTAGGRLVVAPGMVIQGDGPTWPGTMLPSRFNTAVTINRLPINVRGDQAAVFPSGAVVALDRSGQ